MSSTPSSYRLIRSLALVLGFLVISLSSFGQGMRFQVWTDFNARFELKNKFQINAEPGYRIEPESGIQTFYLRGAARYSLNRIFSFDLGIANFNVWGAEIFNSVEVRTFQFVFLNWPELWDFDFKVRLGIEQRWFNFPDLRTKEFVHRARLRIGVTSPYFDFWTGLSKLYITANYEVLRDINDEDIDVFVDENRGMIGVGYLDNKRFRGEIEYQVMGLRDRTIGDLLRNTNLLRIRLYYYFRNPES